MERKDITHSNVSKYNNQPPSGYAFSAKRMTDKARGRLGGYWINTANYNEKLQEMDSDRKEGKEITSFDWEWLSRYSNSQAICFNYLRHNGFLKIDINHKN